MLLKNVYTSIDIGSDSIKVVVCELHNNKLNLLATSSVKSKGIKKGLIVNADDAQASIKEAMEEINKVGAKEDAVLNGKFEENSLLELFKDIEQMLGIKINKVIASVPANNAEFTFIKGEVKIINENNVVSSDDIVKVLQSAMKAKITPEKEMVTIIPIDFRLDDAEGMQNPLGHKANKLASRAIMVSTPKKNIISVLSVIESMGIEVVDIMINSIGTINALKTREIDSQVGSIVNIGAETINVALYNKGTIVKNSIIPIGSSAIDDNIAKAYNLTLEKARIVKERFAVCHTKYASKNEFYDVVTKDSKKIRINQAEVSALVSKRYCQLLELIVKEITSLSGKQLDYVMFTGGATNAYRFDMLIKDKLGKKASVGSVTMVGLRNNQNSAAVGNIIYFINKLKLKGREYSMISKEDQDSLSSVNKNTANISSDSMLNKVVGYFFGE